MSSSFAFVDTLAGVAAARQLAPACVATDNPLLANDPRAGGNIQDISSHLQQAEATRLGRQAIEMLLVLDTSLERGEASVRYGGRPGPLHLTMVLRALLSTLIQRGLMAHRALAEHGIGAFLLVVPDQPRWLAGAPWNMARYGCPYRPLAEAGFFNNRPIEHVPVAFTPPASFNDTTIDDFRLRAALVPTAQLVYELGRRLKLLGSGKGSRIAVGKLCETLNETLPWLALRGLGVSRFSMPDFATVPPPPFGAAVRPDPWLAEYAEPVLLEGLAGLGVFPDHAVRAIARVVLQHLAAGLAGLAATVKAINEALEQAFEEAKPPGVLLTSGVYGPAGTQLISLCRERNIALVDFEHGTTTGIAQSVERRLKVSEATTCDVLMASSPRAARSFMRAPTSRAQIEVIGLADQTRRIRLRSLQRRFARRRLNLRRGEIAVMHVSTLLYGGNMRPGDDCPVEHYVFSTEARLLTEVYGNVSKTVLYKPYPTQRFPHHADYRDLLRLAPNVSVIDWADFRYVRSAADIVVTDANSSTIGWCLGADVPIVHLNSRQVNALADNELRDQFYEAFFTVDMDRSEWPHELTRLLNRGVDDLLGEWSRKRPARERLLADGIFGPAGTGRRAAQAIAALHA
jgi:hypothetical protein